MRYYAVKKGRKNGVFHSWENCKVQVHKFRGARFKSFENEDDALIFCGLKPKMRQLSIRKYLNKSKEKKENNEKKEKISVSRFMNVKKGLIF